MTTTPTVWRAAAQANAIDATVAGHTQGHSQIAGLSNGNYVVIWEDDTRSLGTGLEPYDIYAQIFDPLGIAIGAEFIVSGLYEDGNQSVPAITAFTGGGFAVVYQTQDFAAFGDGENVTVEVYDNSGSRLRFDDFRQGAGGPLINDTRPAIAGFSDGSYVVVYEDDENANLDLNAFIVSSAGVIGPELVVDNSVADSANSAVAILSNGGFAIAYQLFNSANSSQDIQLSIRNAAGGSVVEIPLFQGGGDQTAPSVAALTGDAFVVLWQDQNGNGAGVAGFQGKLYSNAGVFIADIDGPALPAGAQVEPIVGGLDDGGFVIAWAEAADGTIRGQRYGAAGATVGSEFTIADADLGSAPHFALLADGRFAVSFTNTDSSPDDDIYVTIWDPRTAPINGTSDPDVLTSRVEGAAVNGLGGDDMLYGQAGNDTLDGGAGGDTMEGLGGDDSYFVDDALNDKVIESAGGGNDRIFASVGFALGTLGAGAEIEYIQTTRTSGTQNIEFYGNGFAQTIMGNAGNNLLDGGAGVDVLYGRGGNDRYVVDNSADKIIDTVGQGYDIVYSIAANYSLRPGVEIEEIMIYNQSDAASTNLAGNEFGQYIIGSSGSNVLVGMGGSDFMSGLAGDDTYYVHDAGDEVQEFSGSGGYDWVLTLVTFVLGNDDRIEKLTAMALGSTDPINLFGNKYANVLTGNDGANILSGGLGQDVMSGRGGGDTYYVHDSNDLVKEAAGGGSDRVYASVSFALGAGSEVERLETISAAAVTPIDLTGNEFAQTIVGNAGSNALKGNGGNDSLAGGNGADNFVYETMGYGQDTVADFQDGIDLLVMFSAVADNINDFIIAGNDTATVLLTLIADNSSTIEIHGAGGANVTVDAGDFIFV